MRNDFSSNYLAHHGILGQKYGVRNGPPYPLDAGDHSASEKKAGYKKSIGGGRNEELYNKKQAKRRNSKNFESDTKEYESAKKRLGKKLVDKEAGRDYNHSKADERTIKQYIKKYGGEKYNPESVKKEYLDWQKKLVDQYDKHQKEKIADIDKAISSNKNQIATEVAKGMVDDFRRWNKEGDYSLPSKFKGKSDSEIESILSKKIAKNISNYDPDNVYKFNDDEFDFVIDGLSEYSDYAPLTVEYNKKTKKVDFHYT